MTASTSAGEGTSIARHAARVLVVGLVVVALSYVTVGINQRLYATFPELTAVKASSTFFYLCWVALCAAFTLGWPDIGTIRWRDRRPISRGDWLLLGGVVFGTAFLYQNAIFKLVGGSAHAPASALTLIAGGILGPVTEEWLFRGLVFNAYRKSHARFGVVSAIVAGSMVFGLWHLSFDGHSLEGLRMAVVHAVFGVMMALLRSRFDGLVLASALHVAGNSLAVLTS